MFTVPAASDSGHGHSNELEDAESWKTGPCSAGTLFSFGAGHIAADPHTRKMMHYQAGFPIEDSPRDEQACPGGVCAMTNRGNNASAIDAGSAVGNKVRNMTYQEALALSQDTPCLVNFGSKMCTWCTKLQPTYEEASAHAEVPLVYVAAENETDRSAVQDFGIEGYPHVALVHQGRQLAVLGNDKRTVSDIVGLSSQGHALLGGAAPGGAGHTYNDDASVAEAGRAIADAIAAGRKLLVAVVAPWCFYCTKMKTDLKAMSDAGDLPCDVMLVDSGKVTTAQKEGSRPEFATGMQGFPHLNLVTSTGTSVTAAGYRPQAEFQAWVHSA